MTLAPRLYDCSSRTASDVHSEPYADVLASNRSTTTLFSQFRSQMPEPSQLLHELRMRSFWQMSDHPLRMPKPPYSLQRLLDECGDTCGGEVRGRTCGGKAAVSRTETFVQQGFRGRPERTARHLHARIRETKRDCRGKVTDGTVKRRCPVEDVPSSQLQSFSIEAGTSRCYIKRRNG
jgi:hypothetical protein